MGLPRGGIVVKNSACHWIKPWFPAHLYDTLFEIHQPGNQKKIEFAWESKRCGFNPWVGKIPWSKKWQPTPVFLPGKSHGRRSLVGLQSRGRKESDTTEQGPSKQCELWQKEGTPVTAESRALETGRPGSESHLHPQV